MSFVTKPRNFMTIRLSEFTVFLSRHCFLFFSLAIMRYIVSKKKLPAQWFAADNPKNQARVDEFLSWQGSTIRSNCITVFQGMVSYIKLVI
jgi:glutathione S-transferase